MDALIQTTILRASPMQRAQLLSSASQYITNTNLTNLLQTVDINNPKKFRWSMLTAFNAVPGLYNEVKIWVES
jgi:hypothetical protein